MTAAPPDPRVTLANERTLLAWVRTSLGLIAGGVAVTQLTEPFALPWGRRLLALGLIGLGSTLALLAHRQWRRRDAGLAAGRPMAPSTLPWVVTLGVVAVAVVAAIVALSGPRA